MMNVYALLVFCTVELCHSIEIRNQVFTRKDAVTGPSEMTYHPVTSKTECALNCLDEDDCTGLVYCNTYPKICSLFDNMVVVPVNVPDPMCLVYLDKSLQDGTTPEASTITWATTTSEATTTTEATTATEATTITEITTTTEAATTVEATTTTETTTTTEATTTLEATTTTVVTTTSDATTTTVVTTPEATTTTEATTTLEATTTTEPTTTTVATTTSEATTLTEATTTTEVIITTGSTPLICQNGGTPASGSCTCPPATTGSSCQTRIQDCKDVGLHMSPPNPGIYPVWPMSSAAPFEIECSNFNDNRIQIMFRHTKPGVCPSPPVTFLDKPWPDYKNGFTHNCYAWLGLEKIHHFTTSKPYKLVMDILNQNHEPTKATYNNFVIGNENSEYKLTVSGFSAQGNIGDHFQLDDPSKTMNGVNFCTIDHCVTSGQTCGSVGSGGWWYRQDFCQSNPHQKSGIQWQDASSPKQMKDIAMWLVPVRAP